MSGRVPKRFRGVSFDRKPICDIDALVLRPVHLFLRGLDAHLDKGRGLWFYGDVGTGKTSLAMLVTQEALKRGRSAAVYSVPRLLALLKETYDRDSVDTYDSLFSALCAVDLLVLDDVGSEKQTEWVSEQLFSIVNERWQDESSIIITTNLPKADPSAALSKLEDEIRRLATLRRTQAGTDALTEVAGRLESVVDELRQLEAGHHADPLNYIRDHVGERTVSRLIEICDEPVPIMGADQRLAAQDAGALG